MALEKSKTMFDDCANETTPETIEDCVNQDKVTTNLWNWARRLEIFGKILLALIIIGGILISFSDANTVAEVVDGEAEFQVKVFLVDMLTYVIYAFVEYCVYHVVALLIGSLARIVQSNRTVARLAELEARNKARHQE